MSGRRIEGGPEEAEIVDLTHEGHGVARIDGKAVFVVGALPGERVALRRYRRHGRYDEATTEQVLRASPARTATPCPHYGVCGGCALQHVAPGPQLGFKQEWLLQNLQRIGGVAPRTVLAPLTGPAWGYRRRARLGVKFVARKGRVLVGFRERSAPYVADLSECRILQPPAGELIAPLAGLIGRLSIASRLPQVEVAVGDDATALVLRVLDPPSEADRAALAAFAAERGVRLYLQPGGPDTVAPLDGPAPPLVYRLPEHAVELEFEPTDFVQVNAALNRAMVTRALELLATTGDDAVLDLFCGLGNFTLPIARRSRFVVGVEGDPGLVRRARANAERNGIGNVEFHAADLSGEVAAQGWARRRFDRVLVDPPRAGARGILPLLAASGASRVVYISCHAASLARDAGLLVQEHGFELQAAGVMDMFPHTTHVEALAVFER